MLRKVAFTENSIVVTLEVTNGSRQAIELSAKDDMYLQDNTGGYTGNRYNLSPPPNNPTLVIQPSTTVTVNCVFIGRLAPKATELTLYTNASTPSYSQENAQRPNMRFEGIFIRR
jgi:hypothetical protein